MLSTAQQALALFQLKHQQPGQCGTVMYDESKQQLQACASLWLPAAQLLVECVLLVPTVNMASSCLQLITWLMQQVNAALKLACSNSETEIREEYKMKYAQW
jgi:hypothetical protein